MSYTKPNCVWSCYGSICPDSFVNADGVCKEHAKDKCWCGEQSFSGCNSCGQFVCGRPLCKTHVGMCPAHGGVQPILDPVERTFRDGYAAGWIDDGVDPEGVDVIWARYKQNREKED